MLHCPKCKVDYEEGKKFCKHCGTQLEPMVQAQPTTLAEDASIKEEPTPKEHVGTAEQNLLQCANCGAEYEEGKNFCKNCGASLSVKSKSFPSTSDKITTTETKPLSIKIDKREIVKERSPDTHISLVKEFIRYLRERKILRSLLKEAKKLFGETQRLESLLSNLEAQRSLVSQEVFSSTSNQYNNQLKTLKNRLHTIKVTLNESKGKIEKEIKTLTTELTPFQKRFTEISSLFNSGALSKNDFKSQKKLLKKNITRRRWVLKLRNYLLKTVSIDHTVQSSFLIKNIWKPAVIILITLILTGGAIRLFLSFKGDYQEVKKVLDNIRQANINEDIDLFMSCYSKEFPNYQNKKKQTLKNWSDYDFKTMDYVIKEKDISDDKAVIKLIWNTTIHSPKTQKTQELIDKLKVSFRKENVNWNIVKIEKDLEKQE